MSNLRLNGNKVYHTKYPHNTPKGRNALIIREALNHHQEAGYNTE